MMEIELLKKCLKFPKNNIEEFNLGFLKTASLSNDPYL